MDNPSTFSDLRPISLCNFCAKIISKIITNRLGPILPQIISLEQSGFTKNRAITDNILLVQELLQKLNHKARGGNVIMKIDLYKAYDRLSRLFLLHVLRQFGFSEPFIDLIWRLICNCWYSVLVNGQVQGFF